MSGLTLIEWQDSARPFAEWRYLDDAPSLDVVFCKSVGWIVGESDDVVMLTPNVGDVGKESEQGCGFLRIPKRSITRRVSLTEPA